MSKLKKFFQQQNRQEKVRKAKEKFKAKTFYQSYHTLYVFLKVFRYLLALFSIITGAYFLLDTLSFIPYAIAILISGSLFISLEAIKNELIDTTLINYYTKGLNLVIIPTLLLFSGSVYLSVNGVREIHSTLDKDVTAIEDKYQFAKDSIHTKYDTLLARKQAETEKFVWKGKINMYEEGTSQTVQRINIELNNIQVDKNNSLEEAKVKYEELIFLAKKDNAFQSDFWIIVSIVVELLIITCLWFVTFFDYKIAEEDEKAKEGGEVETYEIDTTTFNKLIQLARFYTGNPNVIQTINKKDERLNENTTEQRKIGFETFISPRSNVQTKEDEYLKQYKEVVTFIQEGYTEKQILENANIGRSTLYKIKAILRNQNK